MEIPTHWICLREHLKTGNPYDMGFYRCFPVKIFPTKPIKIDPTYLLWMKTLTPLFWYHFGLFAGTG
jgi:hypothetical protein